MDRPAIHVRGLRVRAGAKTLLALEDLTAAEGEFLAVLGPNGAGKTTLLRCLLGLQHGLAGEVEVLGQSVTGPGLGRLTRLRRRIGYVPQRLSGGGQTPLTVREVVAIGRTGLVGLLRRLGAEDWRIVDKWIDRLGLALLADRGYAEISGGEQRKTLIARAMAQDPRLLLLDEPTANLDLGWRERMVALISQLHHTEQMTVVLVCHELEVLPACCRRLVLLDAGRLLAVGSPEEVITQGRLEALYGPGLTLWREGGRLAVVPREAAHA